MANDLEDFLKRAAQRRAQNTAVREEQRQREKPRPASPQSRQYTDRDRERTPAMLDDDEDIIVAEVVPTRAQTQAPPTPIRTLTDTSISDRHLSSLAGGGSIQRTEQQFDARTQQDLNHHVGRYDDSPGFAGESTKKKTTSAMSAPLLKLLRTPDGIRQAFLMREILDRPADRWNEF